MKTLRTPDGEWQRIDHASAEWMVRHERGLDPSEQDDFFRWLAEDPRHGEGFARHRQTWRELNKLAQWRPEHSAEPNPDLLAKRASLGYSVRDLFDPTRRAFWIRAAVLVAACVAWFFVVAPQGTDQNGEPHASTLTVNCERRELDDGSVIELNRGAQIEVAYTDRERRVVLQRGEALFTVAKDSTRPFVVRAGLIDIRAVGTAFNVRLDHKNVEVLVTEGAVSVQPEATAAKPRTTLLGSVKESGAPTEAVGETAAEAASGSVHLSAGQIVLLPLAPEQVDRPQVNSVTAREMEQKLAWQPRLLEFEATPLAEVVATFNRHNAVKLVLADPELASLPIVAIFRSDNLESFVNLLEKSGRVRVERAATTLTLRGVR